MTRTARDKKRNERKSAIYHHVRWVWDRTGNGSSIDSISIALSLTPRMARNLVNSLREDKVLKKVGRGPKTTYVPSKTSQRLPPVAPPVDNVARIRSLQRRLKVEHGVKAVLVEGGKFELSVDDVERLLLELES